MRYEGRDIFAINVPRSGLTFAPAFEWIMAAQWAGYRLREFRELEGIEQAEIVAAYRVSMQAEAVVHHESSKKAERNRKRRSARAGTK